MSVWRKARRISAAIATFQSIYQLNQSYKISSMHTIKKEPVGIGFESTDTS